jgi:hypothetical protein
MMEMDILTEHDRKDKHDMIPSEITVNRNYKMLETIA